MTSSEVNPWLNRLAVCTAAATLGLIALGGLVTSHGAGMAVPDWPTTYGYNMFFFPVSHWIGGIFYEHTHRLWASFVGLLTATLTAWIWVRESRGVSKWIGLGGVILTLGLMGVRTQPMFVALASVALIVIVFGFVQLAKDDRPLRWAAAIAFSAVLVQGVLGGLRVTLLKDQIGILHGTLAQLFFVLVSLIALFTSNLWRRVKSRPVAKVSRSWRVILATATALIFAQLILGATMRHQHAGLAVPDFPLAYGKIWPSMDEASLELANQRRIDARDFKMITPFHIGLHMAHRIGALLALTAVVAFVWLTRKELGPIGGLTRLGWGWLAIVLSQATLGAATVLSNKAADIATAHVVLGALSLLCGGVLCAFTYRLTVLRETGVKSDCQERQGNSLSHAALASRSI